MKSPRAWLLDRSLMWAITPAGLKAVEAFVLAHPGYNLEARQVAPTAPTGTHEKVLWVNVHKLQGLTLGPSGPEVSITDCRHIFDAELVEEHDSACKIIVTTGSEHGGPTPNQPFWVERKTIRFINRGESVPELNTDPEEDRLRRLVDGI